MTSPLGLNHHDNEILQTTIDRWYDADYGTRVQMGKAVMKFINENALIANGPLQCVCLGILTSIKDAPDMNWNFKVKYGVVFLHWMFRKANPSRPGWNDFHMVRWLMLRREDDLHEIMRRSTLPDGPVGSSCRWMVDSMREQNKDFAIAVARYSGFTQNGPVV